MVIGYHHYYNAATRCSLDFNRLAYNISRTLHNRLGKYKDSRKDKHALASIKNQYNTRAKLYTVKDITLLPIH